MELCLTNLAENLRLLCRPHKSLSCLQRHIKGQVKLINCHAILRIEKAIDEQLCRFLTCNFLTNPSLPKWKPKSCPPNLWRRSGPAAGQRVWKFCRGRKGRGE